MSQAVLALLPLPLGEGWGEGAAAEGSHAGVLAGRWPSLAVRVPACKPEPLRGLAACGSKAPLRPQPSPRGRGRNTGRVAMMLACALLAACTTTSPPERFHTLLPATTEASASNAGANPIYVELLPVRIPPQVDHPQWVVRASDDSLRMLEQERWAAPLRDELRSALGERLASRWGAMPVLSLPQPVNPVWRIRVDVLRFESVPAREVRIDSSWSLSSARRGDAALACHSTLRENVAQGGVPALAAAHRRAVLRLADEIGQQLAQLRNGQVPACPAVQ